jgi:hypothetical protein
MSGRPSGIRSTDHADLPAVALAEALVCAGCPSSATTADRATPIAMHVLTIPVTTGSRMFVS